MVPLTKRRFLSTTSSIFDPLGLLAPIIIIPKIIMQELWKAKVGWDEELPPQLNKLCISCLEDLASQCIITVPRHIMSNDSRVYHLHGFCDASETAYGACIYIVFCSGIQKSSQLLTSKSRVAPLQKISLPRLELCGALLLSKLLKYVLTPIKSSPASITLWSDSTITLAWIENPPYKWTTFV
jgi:hypothetical protein